MGAVFAALAIIFGAFGAHVVEEHLPAVHASSEPKQVAGFEMPASYKYLQDFRTASHYHLVHSLAIVLVGLLGRRGKARIIGHAAAGCFVAGILLFSGSLYLLATTGVLWLGMVTPIGGLIFIAGWALFAVAAGMPRASRH
ncbi:MAG: DUF423 domain-containing protein [Planctomycetota bacterium]|nr:DUF423 domain-containing protein [Planctomycetota bacterium]